MRRTLVPTGIFSATLLTTSLLARPAALAEAPSPAPAPPALPVAAAPKKKPKLVAVVLPETKRVLGYEKVRPYTIPELQAEPPVEPSETSVIEITGPEESLVLLRPWSSPLLGAVVGGGRVAVRGVLHARSASACPTRLWYGVAPAGWVCSKGARPSTEAPTAGAVLQVPEGERLPFHYVMVGLKEGESIPMWASLPDARDGAEPERKLERGDTVAIEKQVKIDGVLHYVSVEGKVLPAAGTFALKEPSAWAGVPLDEQTPLPFGWITPEQAKVYPDGSGRAKPTDVVERRTRLPILEEAGEGARRMLRVGEARWVRAADVNEVRKIPRPDGITAARQWIDVDLGEQVLVAYEGDKPVFATLTSSGRAIPTPRGNYPVWAKVSAISMKSQPYEDKSYFVNKVPWVMFFQAHNAIHGAYWHDRFGVSKSHGCVNVSPLDARHLFEWLEPGLPGGWSGWRMPDLLASPTVHVRNSHQKKELVQERPIGPPDRELEQLKLEEAEERRATAGAEAPVVSPLGAPPPGMKP